MSEPLYTPGPWEAERINWRGEPVEHKVYVRGGIIEPEDGVCEGTSTGVCIVEGNPTSKAVTDANARLIAAAPDLLAACEAALAYDAAIQKRAVEGAVDIMDTGGAVACGDDLDALHADWIAKASAAVAKAKGG